MRKLAIILALTNCLFLLSTFSTPAQVVTGIQPLGSYGGGPDAVNLANLNVHIDVPIVAKAGRGLNFVYALDTTVPYGIPQLERGLPASGWGWTAETQTETGYVTATTSLWKYFSGGSWSWTTNYTKWVYYDRAGTPHPFSLPTIGSCSQFAHGATGTATDGSGYQNKRINRVGDDPGCWRPHDRPSLQRWNRNRHCRGHERERDHLRWDHVHRYPRHVSSYVQRDQSGLHALYSTLRGHRSVHNKLCYPYGKDELRMRRDCRARPQIAYRS